MSLEEANEISGNLFEVPNLASLIQQKRASHLNLSPGDNSAVNEFLGECEQDILSLRKKVLSTIATIFRLCNEVSTAAALLQRKSGQRDLCQYLLSPIRYIHQDLLEPIFMAYSESDHLRGRSTQTIPLRVASVCYRWREIAHATPALWSRVSANDLCNSFDLAKLWLSRCRFPSLMLDMRDIPLEQLADLLVSPGEPQIQIQRLELYLPSGNNQAILQTILNGHSDELNEIVLIQKEGNRVNDLPVPHVKRLYIDRPPTSWNHDLPPQQLTILRITGDLHWEMLDLILLHCVVLQKLYVALAEAGLRSEQRVALKKPATHSHLSYLGLSYDPPNQKLPMDLLSNLSFPSLKIFECRIGSWTPSAEEPACAPTDWFLSLSFLGQLKRLSFSPDLKVSHGFYSSLFSVLNSAEELSFFFYLTAESKPEIFEALTTIFCSSGSPRQLPKLKHLHFSSADDLTSASNDILRVGQLWASTTACQNSRQQPQSCSLSLHQYQPRSETDNKSNINLKRLELLEEFREKCPELQVQFYCRAYKLSVWILGFPLVFEMYPLAFNEVREYQVMDQTGNWTRESGPIYRIL
ncbi:hypothetical protein BDN72DRAFT_846689 [Pluteus cervinus]|uniref:Uncharacterized protein n=1 Tax=Pluteus cervinus TaxID=181527 RepID=A0ACD3AHL4_9AGAR|nr:hypothetical protein BDN72DRAFT_846689 [Pluteus cervinus]